MRSDGRKHLLRWHFLKPAKNLGRGEHLFTLVSELGHGGVRQSRPRAGPTGRPWQPSPWAGAAAGPGCSACSPPPRPQGLQLTETPRVHRRGSWAFSERTPAKDGRALHRLRAPGTCGVDGVEE